MKDNNVIFPKNRRERKNVYRKFGRFTNRRNLKDKNVIKFGCFKNKREVLEDKCVVEVLAQQLANSGCIITTRLSQLLRAFLAAMFRK